MPRTGIGHPGNGPDSYLHVRFESFESFLDVHVLFSLSQVAVP